ncbi:hypothetical protein ACFYTU_48885 [Nonomuraea angiospora]|uniref:hypothetical protein n=1 Tax=Nonomuraea angiospora TaxID=46172 RepID=UPI0036BD80BA
MVLLRRDGVLSGWVGDVEEAEQRPAQDRPLLGPTFLPEIERRLAHVRSRPARLS